MVNWSFGVFDLFFWLFAVAVAYYVAFVLDIRHYFIKMRDDKKAKIRRRPDEAEPLKLDTVIRGMMCFAYQSVLWMYCLQ